MSARKPRPKPSGENVFIVAPGSPTAARWGCLCPAGRNHHGAGLKGGTVKTPDGAPVYAIHTRCPIHAPIFREGTE